jgi:hypothetical protein
MMALRPASERGCDEMWFGAGTSFFTRRCGLHTPISMDTRPGHSAAIRAGHTHCMAAAYPGAASRPYVLNFWKVAGPPE